MEAQQVWKMVLPEYRVQKSFDQQNALNFLNLNFSAF